MSPAFQFIAATIAYFCIIVALVYYTPYSTSFIFLGCVAVTYAYMYIGQLTNSGGLSYLALLVLFLTLFLIFCIFYGFVLAQGDRIKDKIFTRLFDTLDLSSGTNSLQTQPKQITWYNPCTIEFGLKVTNSEQTFNCDANTTLFTITTDTNNIFKMDLFPSHDCIIGAKSSDKLDYGWYALYVYSSSNVGNQVPSNINIADGEYHSFIFNIQGNMMDTYIDGAYLGQTQIGNPGFTISQENTPRIKFGSGLPITLANFKIEHAVNIPAKSWYNVQ